jgi:transcriptional regulator with XRE-family HTH domain
MAIAPDRIALAVGSELRRLRRRAGLSQRQVALAIDSYREIIGRAERGLHTQRLDIVVAHAAVCGGTLRDIGRAIDRAMGVRYRRPSARASATEPRA